MSGLSDHELHLCNCLNTNVCVKVFGSAEHVHHAEYVHHVHPYLQEDNNIRLQISNRDIFGEGILTKGYT
jgi:hypothetical protein